MYTKTESEKHVMKLKFKHKATRYERAEGLSTSIKNPNEMISLVEKSTGFLFYA